MTVDMYERRFRQELGKLAPFVPSDKRDPSVWNEGFPAWRAIFTSLCLWGHSTGYRLPSFDSFFQQCETAYCKRNPEPQRFACYFEGDLLPGMRQRAGVWYKSGMAETYLYVCLVEAIEDKTGEGLVIYDARLDWKQKIDACVIIRGKPILVSAFVGDLDGRPGLEARRESIERIRKVNTAESAQWNNDELQRLPKLVISRRADDYQSVNGVRLFSLAAINALLDKIYEHGEITGGYHFPDR